MAWFKKKPDPISNRERMLNEEISQLEEQIRQLDAKLQQEKALPKLRSTALPHGGTVPHPGGSDSAANLAPVPEEPIFVDIDKETLKNRANPGATPAHYNELGVRKYDLPALVRRIRNHFRGPSTTNPKLVSYLAAGGIQGLRPMRYEKRVARNRFIALVIILFLTLLGIILVFFRHR